MPLAETLNPPIYAVNVVSTCISALAENIAPIFLIEVTDANSIPVPYPARPPGMLGGKKPHHDLVISTFPPHIHHRSLWRSRTRFRRRLLASPNQVILPYTGDWTVGAVELWGSNNPSQSFAPIFEARIACIRPP
jgi:hypothetical protein